MRLKLGGKRAEAIAIDDILHALKIGFEIRPCASEERKICHCLSRVPRASGQSRLSLPDPEQYALVAGYVDGNDCRGMARF